MKEFMPQNKKELLSAIYEKRGILDSMIERLSDEMKSIPDVEANWSVKDIMAHIAAWERLAQDRIHAALTGEALNFPVIENHHFVDEFNDRVYKASKDSPLEQVEAEYHKSHSDFIAKISALDEETLQSELPFDWAGDLTFLLLISANTHWHYAEHTNSIQNWFSGIRIDH